MATLKDLLAQEGRAAVVGLGGVGKTQLVSAYIQESANDFDFIWWLRSHHREVLSADYEAINAALHLRTDGGDARAGVQAWLHTHSRWLLIFDDVTDTAKVQDFIPLAKGTGQVILTSRSRLDLPCKTLELHDWSMEDSRAFLQDYVTGSPETIEAIATQLCNVPLALDQAAAYMRATGIDASTYLRLLQGNSTEVLRSGRAFDRDDSIATTWAVSVDLAEAEGTGARDLLTLCSFYAGSAIPRQLPVLASETKGVAASPPRRFRSLISSEVSYNEMLSSLSRQSLLTMDSTNLYVHGLVQKAVRTSLSPVQRQRWTYYAASSLWLLLRGLPTEGSSKEQISTAEILMPHVLSVAEQAEDNVPHSWPYIYNYPSWTAIRESARTLEGIAFHLSAIPDKSRGEDAALRALELAVEAYPFLLSFAQRPDILAFTTLIGSCEAVTHYSIVTSNSERAEPALRKAFELFPDKMPQRKPIIFGNAHRAFRLVMQARLKVLICLSQVLVVAQKPDEARSLLQMARDEIERFKFIDPSGTQNEEVTTMIAAIDQAIHKPE